MIKANEHEGDQGKALWFGRIPEHPPELNQEYLLLAITPKRVEFSNLVKGDCGVRMSREQAVRFAKNILDEVCALDAVAAARADGAKRVS